MNRFKSVTLVALTLLIAPFSKAASEENLQLAREVIKLTQMDKMMESMAPQMEQMSRQAIAPMTANLPEEKRADLEKLHAEVSKLTINSARDMLKQLDRLYAEVYTAQELTAMKTFFTSPEGKGMIEKQPILMQKMMPMVQTMQAELMPKVQALVEQFKNEQPAAAQP